MDMQDGLTQNIKEGFSVYNTFKRNELKTTALAWITGIIHASSHHMLLKIGNNGNGHL